MNSEIDSLAFLGTKTSPLKSLLNVNLYWESMVLSQHNECLEMPTVIILYICLNLTYLGTM
jgi:hypothetical protein